MRRKALNPSGCASMLLIARSWFRCISKIKLRLVHMQQQHTCISSIVAGFVAASMV
jgi:hypothetical protein